ncbi:ANTAR domain-containing protein [Streptomyces sp. NPDC054863]
MPQPRTTSGTIPPHPESPAELRAEIEWLRRALETQPVIDMARGMVMAMAPCSQAQAWQVLVEVSQHTNVKLHIVARRLVDSVQGPPPCRPIRDALAKALDRVRQGDGAPA